MRQMFNARVLPRVGDDVMEIVTRSAPASPRSGQPRGTVSEEVSYYTGTEQLARAHRFLTPDGEVGGSGLPDPKVVVLDGTMYVLRM